MEPVQHVEPVKSSAPAVDGEARGELRDAARRIEHADQRAQHRIADAELGAQQRKERRQRELEEMRRRMGEADDADHLRVAAERVGMNGIQGA